METDSSSHVLPIHELFYSHRLGIVGPIVHYKSALIIHRCLRNAHFCSSFCRLPCCLSPGSGLVHSLRGGLRHQRGGAGHHQLQALTPADENR